MIDIIGVDCSTDPKKLGKEETREETRHPSKSLVRLNATSPKLHTRVTYWKDPE